MSNRAGALSIAALDAPRIVGAVTLEHTASISGQPVGNSSPDAL
ncbi:MAG: hypothetical protein ACM3N4_08475 [Nitrososphaerota archaeon]